MKLHVDQEKCEGCGACARLFSKIFRIVDGKSSLLQQITGFDALKKCDEAVDACPNGALYIE